jgi:hypothetical protein
MDRDSKPLSKAVGTGSGNWKTARWIGHEKCARKTLQMIRKSQPHQILILLTSQCTLVKCCNSFFSFLSWKEATLMSFLYRGWNSNLLHSKFWNCSSCTVQSGPHQNCDIMKAKLSNSPLLWNCYRSCSSLELRFQNAGKHHCTKTSWLKWIFHLGRRGKKWAISNTSRTHDGNTDGRHIET